MELCGDTPWKEGIFMWMRIKMAIMRFMQGRNGVDNLGYHALWAGLGLQIVGIFIGLPLLAFIIYDIIRRQQYARKESKKTAELEAELERLRKLAGERESQ